MHARVVNMKFQPHRMDEAISIYRGITAVGQQKGYKSVLLLTDRNTGKSISVSPWKTEADMIATETSGWWQEQPDKFAPVQTEQPVREHYEVSVQMQARIRNALRLVLYMTSGAASLSVPFQWLNSS